MFEQHSHRVLGRRLAALLRPGLASVVVVLTLLAVSAPLLWAQVGATGAITVTVTDTTGSVIPGADLQLVDAATGDVRTATTQSVGNYRFGNLPLGTYSLTVKKTGFQQQVFTVAVNASQTTDLKSTLQVGATTQTVEVQGESAPLVQTTTNTIGTTVTAAQVQNLPLSGRDISQLAKLMPGYNGTWNGLPTAAFGDNVDGVVASSSRMKFGGSGATPQVAVRLENIEEMSVQTDSLDTNQGVGNSAIQLNFSTRRGTNAFHGRVFEDHRNAALNANSWTNGARGLKKAPLILNDFGGSLGGPIFRDKLFFFGSFAMSKQPSGLENSVPVFTPAAQTGVFTYGGKQVNLLQLAATNGFRSTIHPLIASQFGKINQTYQDGALTASGDPNVNALSWVYSAPQTYYYPTVRVDYNTTQNLRMNFSFNEQKYLLQNATMPTLPGPDFLKLTAANSRSVSYTAGYGLDWTISPTVINQFRGGYLYFAQWFADGFDESQHLTLPHVATSYTNPLDTTSNAGIGLSYPGPNSRYFPNFNAQDTVSIQKGAHGLNFGVSYWREQDHYWDPPGGWANYTLGMNANDPANGMFTATNFPGASSTDLARARALYTLLVGDVGSPTGAGVSGRYGYETSLGTYKTDGVSRAILNELQTQWGLFAQDNWRIRPSLTLNLGLRWDLVGANHDLRKQYHSGSAADLFGPSGVDNLFNPGSLQGTMNPMLDTRPDPYNGWNVTPQPILGLAWNPKVSSGLLGRLLGGDATVIRAGYALRRFVEPQQFFWNQASNNGAFYYQQLRLTPGVDYSPGSFALPGNPGASTVPPIAWNASPKTYLPSAPVSAYTFNSGTGLNGFNQNIDQPYTQSWNFGIQRRLGNSRVLEVRYNGNRTIHHWITMNTNEVNVFAAKPGEDNFVTQFQHAQQNLAINAKNGINNSFQYNGFPGQVATPVFNAAFAGASAANGYGNSAFIQELQQGEAGRMAYALSGAGATGARYLCNLVGASFTPCAANLGYTGAGAGYPINYFQANPFKAGEGVFYLNSAGYATYNGLQVDLRQQVWHGLQFDANYTWSKNLGVEPGTDWQGNYAAFTLRDLHQSYLPTGFDRRHVFHFAPVYDLPFGTGHAFLNQGGALNKIVGGWTVSSIVTVETGNPFRLTSGYQTFNQIGDSGVVLNGVTAKELQDSVGVYRVDPATYGKRVDFVDLINPKYIAGGLRGNANSAYIQPAATPGQFGQNVILYGPRQTYVDMALSKAVPITERLRFRFQAEFLNAFNHPVFGYTEGTGLAQVGVLGGAFGSVTGVVGANTVGTQTVSGGTAARQIEFRANIEF
jgi:hypothetical protein